MSTREAPVRVEAPAPAPAKPKAESAPYAELAPAPPAVRSTPLLVDDERDVPYGALQSSTFLAELRAAVCAASDVELARVGRDSAGCPYIQRWFDHYERGSAADVVAALRRFAPEVAATSARDYVPAVVARVRDAVARWTETGEVTGLPPGMDRLPPVGIFGLGQALAATTREPMERALGHDFARVRVHPDSSAPARLGARAVAVGEEVAFAPGEYRPGTPAGDAVLAHELAHVAQQRPGGPAADGAALERDADAAAGGAVRALWRGDRATVRPGLSSGLRLQRCSNTPAPVSDLGRLEAMTPWQLSQLPESSFSQPATGRSGEGHTLADFHRAWQLVRCVFRGQRTVTADPDVPVPLGEPVTDPRQLAAIRSGYARMRQYRAESLAATGGDAGLPAPPAPADVRVRIVSGDQLRIKVYQSIVGLLGVPPEMRDLVRRTWTEPDCAVTVNPNPVVTTQEMRALALVQTMGGEGGMLFEPEQTIYLTASIARQLTADTPEGTDARLTLTHETGHLLGAKSRTKAAFRAHFGDPAYECYWIAFEEGMTERTTRRATAGVHGGTAEPATPAPPPTPQGRHYQGFVLLMDAVAAEVGNPVVERAYYDGNPPPAVFASVQRLFPVHVGSGEPLPGHCASRVRQ